MQARAYLAVPGELSPPAPQQMCKGGFNLGIGSREAENLVPFNYPYDRPVAALERFLKVLRHILWIRAACRPGRAALGCRSDTIDAVADTAADGLERIGRDTARCFAFLRHSGLRL